MEITDATISQIDRVVSSNLRRRRPDRLLICGENNTR